VRRGRPESIWGRSDEEGNSVDGLKGIAEVIEHILYEVLGLLLPGACFVLAVAYVWGGTTWADALRFACEQPWIAGGAAYLLGFVVQGLSRPVTGATEWILRSPARLLTWLYRLGMPEQARTVVATWRARGAAVLFDRHRHSTTTVPAGQAVNLDSVAEAFWRKRLHIGEDRRLSWSQVRDLSFSALISERNRLDRFRAATSLCRGVATTVAICIAIMVMQLVREERSISWVSAGWIAGLLLAFYALLERADMYNKLWNAVVQPQFLASATAEERRKNQPGDSGEAEG
jgi:hypothetical protein